MGDMGILTTATDLARWSIAQDKATILDKQTLEQMWTPSRLNNGLQAKGIVGVSYGMGWGLSDHRGYKEGGHGGSFINGYTAQFTRFPDIGFAVVVLCNLNPSRVQWISYNIARFFIPQLQGLDQLTQIKSADTSFNKNARDFLQSLGTGNYDRSFVTESLIQRINPITKIVFNGPETPRLSFISSDNLKTPIERYGIVVNRINFYRTELGGETHYFAIYLTKENKIADFRGY